MKRKNRKTVETRLSFAAASSSPHPFVAFILSESLGKRLGEEWPAVEADVCVSITNS